MQLFHTVRHHIFSHVNISSMKKLALLLFVAFISIQISAQEFHFIPRIGFNLANTYPESFADMRPGMNVGVAGEIRFSKLFAIEPGVYYSMQGYHYKYKGQVSKLKIDYLNIPLYAKFYLYRGFHLFAGPQLGINVRAKAHDFVYYTNLPPVEQSTLIPKKDVKDDMSICDLSFSMGAGYAFDMGLIVSVNYNLGCTFIFKESELMLNDYSDFFSGKDHNGVIQFNVGWRF